MKLCMLIDCIDSSNMCLIGFVNDITGSTEEYWKRQDAAQVVAQVS